MLHLPQSALLNIKLKKLKLKKVHMLIYSFITET